MKVVAFNGSGRKDGNTAILIRTTLGVLNQEGAETELIQLAGEPVRGCMACYKCKENKDFRCSIKSDRINEWLEKMLDADGIIIGSPTYFSDVSTETKTLIDRAGFVARQNDHMFKRKVGAAIVAVRRAGAIHTFDSINHFFTISQMIIPGSSYWNIGKGGNKGDVESDKEGLNTMTDLGRNMAWLLKRILD